MPKNFQTIQDLTFPTEFKASVAEMLGNEWAAFEAAHHEPPPVAIRLNPAKKFAAPPEARPIFWSADGYWLCERPVFTLDPAFHAGAYYVQEASSQFLDFALRQVIDVSQAHVVLDLCAAPGGKATLLASILRQGGGLLVANEVVRNRLSVLRENMEKWGYPCVATTSAPATAFGKMEHFFDVVVVDAPCSGEGMFRKDEQARAEWSPHNVQRCARRQQQILSEVARAVRPGGILIYSTCTYNRTENEENTAWLLQNSDFEQVTIKLPDNWGIVQSEGGYRFFPHRLAGEGFFLAIFRKQDSRRQPPQIAGAHFQQLREVEKKKLPTLRQWIQADAELYQTPSGEIWALPPQWIDTYLYLDKRLKIKHFGTTLGEWKGNNVVPGHALALSEWRSSALPTCELELPDALDFLRKNPLSVAAQMPRGWVSPTFRGLPLGWMKVLDQRQNNYLPSGRRIIRL